MMNKFAPSALKVSAPGKIHLLGEHFVVYGAPALLAAVGLRYAVKLTKRQDKTIEISSKNFKTKTKFTIDQLLAKRAKAESDWIQFSKTNDISIIKNITAKPLDFAAVVIGETFKHYKKKPRSGFNVQIESEVPANAGLGSSAATSVALAAATVLFLGQKLNKEVINNIAYEAEKKRHGNPSGADNATVTYGGLIRFIREPKTIEPLGINISKNLTRNFVLINTGKPRKSTGEMVSLVRTLREKKPQLFNACFQSQSQLAESLIPVVKNGDSQEFMRIIRAGEKNLEDIGVVSKFSQKIIRKIEKIGGAAKMCGAGSTTGPTGIILAYHPDKTKVEKIAKLYKLPYFSTSLGVEGVKQEL